MIASNTAADIAPAAVRNPNGSANGANGHQAVEPALPTPAMPPQADGSAPEQAALAPATPPLSPEMVARIGELRTKIQLSVGQIVLAVMNLARYRHQSLADLAHILIEPLLRDRVAIAHRSATAADGTTQVDEHTIAGIAIWATVSDAVDAKITEQVRAGAFPVRLGPDDWASGDTVWLLDVVAGDRRQATAVLANFRQLAGARPVKIHPIVGRLIEPAVLAKLVAANPAPGVEPGTVA